MKNIFLILLFFAASFSVTAAYQYNSKGNQGWLSFDSTMTVGFDLARSGKDKDHENFIDRGEGVADYGWYNLETGESGSFSNGLSATFSAGDRIGLYVTDNTGKTFLSTKLACLLALRQQAVRPTHTLSVTIWPSLIFPQNLFVKLTFNEATQFFSSLITHSNVLLYIPSESLPFVEYC